MTRSTIILFAITGLLLLGCADTKDPASPETGIPYFDVIVTPYILAPLENAFIALSPVLTLEFSEMDGALVGFSSVPDSGFFFDFPYSYIDLDADSRISPPVWFRYTGLGSPDTIDIKIYAHVIGMSGDALAWNFAEVKVVGG